MFRRFDVDESGHLDDLELSNALELMGVDDSTAESMLMSLDTDGDGKVSLNLTLNLTLIGW